MSKQTGAPRADLYQTVTNQIIAALEAGTSPWICPWKRGADDPNPANLSSGRPYRGINVLLLNLQSMTCGYTRNRWLTFRQAQALGGHVRRGEQGSPIVFFKMHDIDEAQATAAAPTGDQSERRATPLLRSFTVFNVDQIDGLPAALLSPITANAEWNAIDCAEQVLAQSGAVIRHGGARAFYQPNLDLIQLPFRSSFRAAADYYATALHELTHWTGHPSRCNRVMGQRKGIEAYAFEELVRTLCLHFPY